MSENIDVAYKGAIHKELLRAQMEAATGRNSKADPLSSVSADSRVNSFKNENPEESSPKVTIAEATTVQSTDANELKDIENCFKGSFGAFLIVSTYNIATGHFLNELHFELLCLTGSIFMFWCWRKALKETRAQ